MNKDKLILTDCDGVLLDWEYHFDVWMQKNGYLIVNRSQYGIHYRYNISKEESVKLIKIFNEHASIGFLSPYKDAIKYVRKLHEEHGYIFHCITAMSDNQYAQRLRRKNLRYVFGDNLFERIVFLDCDQSKYLTLLEYKDSECFWIEDKVKNAETGHQLGLTSLLMKHTHNFDYDGSAQTVNNWKDIYNIIVG
jgi:FMN phosphatase YigB (HAD superfamily)